MPEKLIGLAGPSTSGKDHVADYIAKHFGYLKKTIADPIRAEFSEFLSRALTREANQRNVPSAYQGWIKEFENAVYTKPTSVPNRVGLQEWGDYRRATNDDCWINALDLTDGLCSVISDVRRKKEVQAIKQAGGTIWWIERPISLNEEAWRRHNTERELSADDCDRIISNDSDVPDLESKINFIFRFC